MSTLGVDTLVEETDTVGAINCPSQHAMGPPKRHVPLYLRRPEKICLSEILREEWVWQYKECQTC